MAFVIGIFGTIGSGKTTVAKYMEEKYGFNYISADDIGHYVLTEPDIKEKLIKLFGLAICNKDGFIDRKKVSQVVFADLELKSQLEAILWPKMTITIKNLIKQKKEVILDAALLFSAGWNKLCQYTIYIDITGDKRERFLKIRNISKKQLSQILKSQQEIEKQSSLATFTIHNIGTYQELMLKVDDVMSLIQKRWMEENDPK